MVGKHALDKMWTRGKNLVRKIFKEPRGANSDGNGNLHMDEQFGAMGDDKNTTARQHMPSGKKPDIVSQQEYMRAKLMEKDTLIETQAQKLKQAEALLDKLQSENTRLSADNRTLLMRLSDMEVKLEKSRHLEISSAELLDWIQSVIGYAGNKELFSSDADELSQFRDDVKKLGAILRRNGITYDNTPPDEGLGFVRKRDSRISNGQVISAPMLLRDGVIIAEGILLVPANDDTCLQTGPGHETSPEMAAEKTSADSYGETSEPAVSADTSGEIAHGANSLAEASDHANEKMPPKLEATTNTTATSPYEFDF